MVTEYDGLAGGKSIKYKSAFQFNSQVPITIERILRNIRPVRFWEKIKFRIISGMWVDQYIVETQYADLTRIENVLNENSIQFARVDIGDSMPWTYFCFDNAAISHMRIIQ